MSEMDCPWAENSSVEIGQPRITLRRALAAISFVSILLGLPFFQRLLAAGLGAILATLATLVGLQLLAFVAFRWLGLLPPSDGARAA